MRLNITGKPTYCVIVGGNEFPPIYEAKDLTLVYFQAANIAANTTTDVQIAEETLVDKNGILERKIRGIYLFNIINDERSEFIETAATRAEFQELEQAYESLNSQKEKK